MKVDDKLNEAFQYMELFYNKVLWVNVKENTFRIVKADDTEINNIYGSMTFTQWINDFVMSPYCDKENKIKFLEFNSLDRLKILTRPAALRYKKLIGGDYHNVLEEIIPIGSDIVYLYVKDLTKMLGEEL